MGELFLVLISLSLPDLTLPQRQMSSGIRELVKKREHFAGVCEFSEAIS